METVLPKPTRLVVAVDLLPLRPGGENGGLKPAIFSLLQAVRSQTADAVAFLFFTNSASHAQVRQLAGPDDILACILEDPLYPFVNETERPNEYKLFPAPPNVVQLLEADLLYCPFGATTLHVSGVPTIALIADFLHRDYPFTLSAEQIAEREAYIQKTLDDASLIQCISRAGMERARANYHVAPDRLFYTYLPIHARLDDAASVGDESRPKPSLPDSPFFFYPANLWLHKNHEVLLCGYARYLRLAKSEPWDLVLTFHEDARAQYLRSIARTLGIEGHVHFLGFLPEHDLHRVWRRAGALVFPSLHEGFGIPLLEAMHYQVPIISGDRFSLKEVGGDAIYLIDAKKPASLSDALLEVSRRPELRAQLIERGQQRLRLFDINVAARTLLDAFRAATRRSDDFPRPPRYANAPELVMAPTPASTEPWTIEIQYEAENATKCIVYLGNIPFASFASSNGARKRFSFVCRPEGRILGVRLGSNGQAGGDRQIVITKVVARHAPADEILLYGDPGTGGQ
jgi:glycosyltransferase involved in cell wall biosynthesis